MFKKGDIVVVSEEHKKFVKDNKGDYCPWWVESLDDEFVVQRVGDYGIVEMDAPRNISTGKVLIDAKVLVLKVDKTATQRKHKNTELEYTIEQLKKRLIEAERNALYWTVFDCPVNRDIAERILRKEN